MRNIDIFYRKALVLGKKKHPSAPAEHHAAFANSVVYAIMARTYGAGGPSMREHLASRVIAQKFGAGANRCTFEQAAETLDDVCYGELTLQHAWMLEEEYCFDDAPGEVEAAQKLLATA
jgi:hypothetical protein